MKILFYYPGTLDNRRRGTPHRVYAIYRALAKLADVYLVARELPETTSGPATTLEPHRTGLDWWLQTRVLRSVVDEFHPDLVYGHTHLALLPTLLAARGDIQTCVDLHGLPHYELGMAGIAGRVTSSRHRWLVRRLSGITTVCDPLTAWYRDDAAASYTFYGGIDPRAMDAVAPAAPVQSDASDGPVIAYCGNARPYQGVDTLLAALGNMKAKPWRLLLVLSSGAADVRRLLEIYELGEKTTILESLEQLDVFAHLKAADLAVVPRPNVPITRYAFASKLPEYLASGTAVVATDVGDARRFVIDGDTGWLAKPGDVGALEAALASALESADERIRRGEHARELMRTALDWDVLTDNAFRFLQTL